MQVWTDSLPYAKRVGLSEDGWEAAVSARMDPFVALMLERLEVTGEVFRREVAWPGPWDHLFLVAHAARSQFDAVSHLLRGKELPPVPFLCAAESGRGFHGFKGRPWVGVPGNVHLVACFHPDRPLVYPGVGPIVLSTVAVLETIDELPGLRGRAGVKWVNDILVDGAKVGGIIAWSQAMGDRLQSVLLGMGLNVEQTPVVARDSFVPRVGALSRFAGPGGGLHLADVFPRVVARLGEGYGRYLAGGYAGLLERYRQRSVVVGRPVRILEDCASGVPRQLRRGRVLDIGEGLELYLDDGKAPVVAGRLVFEQVGRQG